MNPLLEVPETQLERARAEYARDPSHGWASELILWRGDDKMLIQLVQDTTSAVASPVDAAIFMIKTFSPEGYCFGSEAWMAMGDPGASPDDYERGDAAKSETRIEIFIQAWCKKGGKVQLRAFTIDRINGQLNPLSELTFKSRFPSAW